MNRFYLSCIISAFAVPAALLAQSVPTTINYQGRLTDNTLSQAPISATVQMQFAIYDTATNGARLWQEPAANSTGTAVAVTNGIFSYMLGSTVAIPSAIYTGASSTRYLQITINPASSAEILSPRQLISGTGYSNLAQNANSALTASSVTNGVYTSGLYPNPSWLTSIDAGKISGTLAASGGGTGITAAPVAAGQYLRSSAAGTWAIGTIQTSDLPAPTAAGYLFAYDNTAQYVYLETFQSISFNTNGPINGWVHTPGSFNFICNQTGLYLIQYQIMISRGTTEPLRGTIQATQNGAAIVGSETTFEQQSLSNYGGSQFTKSFIVLMITGDVLQLQGRGNISGDYFIDGTERGLYVGTSASLIVTRVQ